MFAMKEMKPQPNLRQNSPNPRLARKCTKNCPLEEDKPLLQRRASTPTAAANEAPPIVHEVLRSPGQPLDESTRSFMEPRFNQDFSHVRVHTDAKATESARAVNALAYTVGRDIVMKRDEYAPATDAGKRLLAHELVHVVQQGGNNRLQKLQVGAAGDVYEQEADRVAERVVGVSEPLVQEEQYTPWTGENRWLIAHELVHMGQQTDVSGDHVGKRFGLPTSSQLQPVIQRDLAVEPTVPGAVGGELTPNQIRRAISWNQAAFTDADEITLLRDVLGISSEPAVIDEDFIRALVQYQADFGLTQDGLLGARTAQRLADELQAEATYLGADADVGTATEMALNPAQRRMRLRSRVVSRLGQMLHQGFIGPRDNPSGIVTVRSGLNTDAGTNSIGMNYTGSNVANSRWLQFTFSQMSAIDPITHRRVYRGGSVRTTGGLYNYSNATTFYWNVDTVPATGSMYYETGGTNERTGGHTEIFDQPEGWNTQAETFATTSFATRPSSVRLIKGFDTYLVVNNNSVVYHVRWNLYFNFNTSVTPTTDVAGTYEVLTAGPVNRLPSSEKTRLDTQFPGNTIP